MCVWFLPQLLAYIEWYLLVSLLLLAEVEIRDGWFLSHGLLETQDLKLDFCQRLEQSTLGQGCCLIFSPLVLLLTGFNFSSSGREDVDVRTLGNGKMASAPPDLSQLILCEAIAYCSHLQQWEDLGSSGRGGGGGTMWVVRPLCRLNCVWAAVTSLEMSLSQAWEL